MKTTVVPAMLVLVAAAVVSQDRAFAQTALGTAFTYQGQLTQGGTPVNNTADLQFSLWDALAGPTQVGGTQTVSNVNVVDGLFTVQLNGGGEGNRAGNDSGTTSDGGWSTVGAGFSNTASGYQSTVAGGTANLASGDSATIGGGQENTATASYATVGGGLFCNATGSNATVGGGNENNASGPSSVIAGGEDNAASAFAATVPGGGLNVAAGQYSFAAGRRAKANHDGTFVWGDSSTTDCASTGPDQFLIRAGGGVGTGTTSPERPLHIQDTQAAARLTSTNHTTGSVIELRNDSASTSFLGAIAWLDSAGLSRGWVAYLAGRRAGGAR